MKIRKMNASQMRQSLELDQFAFQFEFTKDEKKNHERIMKPENTWVAEEDGRLMSKLTILPMEVYIGGTLVPMGGISGVATWPESRRNGLVRKLLHSALEDMKSRGQAVSFLYPFSIPFYRNFGWELFADSITWTIKKEQLLSKKEISSGKIRRVPPAEWPTLQRIYQRFAVRYNGMIDRDESWWRYTVLKKKKGQIAVFSNDAGEDRGYMIYQIKNNHMKVHECIALDEEARQQLWRFTANHDSMIEEAEIKPAPGDPSRFMLPDSSIEEKRESYFMARIVDMKRFLELYPFRMEDGQDITFEIEDPGASWNNGVFAVRKNESGNDVEHYSAAEIEGGVKMDINTAAAVFLGYLPVSTAVQTGKMKASDEAEALCEDVLTREPPFIYDFF
ncbi:GNAT family N-acetyltransferase [Salibacterium halotolerans]|uniref:Predicted acetyltransferase n=1 Tax=Salibacterium halotolerans TaxID=1884432 RepID=A0A1I5M118_9BACI|nr:GNAT family N-acetyltransferase [Salibacterium halotolerans]SFP03298.1 Predicted acetyltransferase [Salibacterium halotolerans]